MTTRGAVLSLFDKAKEEIDNQAKYYKDRQAESRSDSVWPRTAATFLFVIGSITPLTVPFFGKIKLPFLDGFGELILPLGYVFLALAGLLLAIDQFFSRSKSWSRHTKAYLKLTFLSDVLAFEKSCFELTAPNEASAHEKLEMTLAKIAEYRAAHHAIVNDETGIWETDLAAAIAAFQTQVTNAKAAVQAAAEQKPPQTAVGTVEVDIEAELSDKLASASLSVGDGQARSIETPFKGPFVFDNAPAGPRRIRLAGMLRGDNAPFLKEIAVKVLADDITRVSLTA
ncbi:MAG: SLATT domain-containing protein [Pseudomonadota bacterium]|jgi:hypothetical protein